MYWNQQGFPNFAKPPVIDPSFLNGQSISYIPRNGDRLPQTVNWVLDIEREVAHNLALDVMYIGSHSTHLGLSGSASLQNYVNASTVAAHVADGSGGFDLLAPCASAGTCAQYPYADFATQLGASATVAQALRPYPQYLLVDTDSVLLPEGKAHYDSMQLKLTKRMSYGLSGLAFFTWSRTLRTMRVRVVQPTQVRLAQSFNIRGSVPPQLTRRTRRRSLAPASRINCR